MITATLKSAACLIKTVDGAVIEFTPGNEFEIIKKTDELVFLEQKDRSYCCSIEQFSRHFVWDVTKKEVTGS